MSSVLAMAPFIKKAHPLAKGHFYRFFKSEWSKLITLQLLNGHTLTDNKRECFQ